MSEIWRKVKGFPLYEVSNFGRVRSTRLPRKTLNKEGFVRLSPDKKGYLWVRLYNKISKNMKVHKLVLETFACKKPKNKECRHLDGDKTNNRIDNLVWGTAKENSADRDSHGYIPLRGEQHGMCKLTEAEVLIIFHSNEPSVEIAKKYSVTKELVNMIRRKAHWKHVVGNLVRGEEHGRPL